jgi:predicted CXXCH cytochrome family protein
MIFGLVVSFCATGLAQRDDPFQIGGTPHDFSSSYGLCIVCHEDPPPPPFSWNHDYSTQVYIPYSSPTLNAADVGQPNEPSDRCLGCHDGTVAIAGNDYIGGPAQVPRNGDLSTHHPISFTYDTDLATEDGGLWDPLTTPSPLGGMIAEDMLFSDQMECSSCHFPHQDSNWYFLVASNAGSSLCLTCHDLGITGSAHDFSGTWWSNGEICLPCHSPHEMWNHELSGSTYTVTTTTLAPVGQPSGVSAQCLGCHEGDVDWPPDIGPAIDSFGGATGGQYIHPSVAFGTDLTDHHPVSYSYSPGLAAAHGGLYDPSTEASGLPAGGTIAEDMLVGGKVECTTCHDLHNPQFTSGPLLVKTDMGGELCLTCHNNGDHTAMQGCRVLHKAGFGTPIASGCTGCHGSNLEGPPPDDDGFAPSCYSCHGKRWSGENDPDGHGEVMGGFAQHMSGLEDPYTNCTECHGADLEGAGTAPSCFSCHGGTWGDHDFSGRPWLGSNNHCHVCHGPPEFNPGVADSTPEWYHDLSPTTGYTVTTSTLAAVGDPTGNSAKCMGCHEGPPTGPAVDDFTGTLGGGTEFIVGSAAFGTDLTGHHPVSFAFDSSLASLHGVLNDPSTAPSNLPSSGTIAEDMLDEAGQLQCTSCHNQHDNTKGHYLVNTGPTLCFTCHTFEAPMGTHHIPDRDNPWHCFRCTMCHGTLLDGTPAEGGDGIAPACTSCHNPFAPLDPPPPGHHGDDRFLPYFDCAPCHADPITGIVTGNDFGSLWAPSCYQCHDDLWVVPGDQQPAPVTMVDLSGTVGQAVTFDASHIIDPEGKPVAYEWSFGDGTLARFPDHQPITTHTYDDFGTYQAALAVTDGVNPPVVVQFDVNVAPRTEEPVADAWIVDTSEPRSFMITFQNHSGSLVGWTDDGTLSFGVELVGVIFWMDLWMDLSGNVFWGAGSMYFGNIDRIAGTMSGVVFDDTGGVATFTGTRSP